MRRHGFAALLGVPALILLWYLAALAFLFQYRDITGGLDQGRLNALPTVERYQVLLEPRNWAWPAAAAFLLAGLVAGLLLAARRWSPAPALVAGLVLTVVGGIGNGTAALAKDLAGPPPAFGGAGDLVGTTTLGAERFLNHGACLLLGAMLLGACLPVPRRAPGRPLSALAGSVLFVGGWALLLEGVWRDAPFRIPMTAAAGLLFGVLAASASLSRIAPLSWGAPAAAVGLFGLVESDDYARQVQRIMPFSFEHGAHYYQVHAVLESAPFLFALLGVALVVAGLAPRRRAVPGPPPVPFPAGRTPRAPAPR